MNEYSKNLYGLPVDREKIKKVITQQYTYPEDRRTHVKNLRFAIDFHVPLDTEVVAAQDGEIAAIRDDDRTGGPDKRFLKGENYIVIEHPNQEFTHYLHLRYGGIAVKLHDRVKIGQPIGYTGYSGYVLDPHLHFEVFVWPSATATPDERQTVKVRFKDLDKFLASILSA